MKLTRRRFTALLVGLVGAGGLGVAGVRLAESGSSRVKRGARGFFRDGSRWWRRADLPGCGTGLCEIAREKETRDAVCLPL